MRKPPSAPGEPRRSHRWDRRTPLLRAGVASAAAVVALSLPGVQASAAGIQASAAVSRAGPPPNPPPAPPPPPPPPPVLPAAQAFVLVDTATGRILNASNDRLPLSPASLSKMLTALVATDYLAAGTPIPVSPRAENVEPDKLGMKAGEVWPLDQVIQALLVISANDAAYALAEKIGGTAENFDPVLADAATQIGMEDHPVFHDPSGLDDSHGIDGGNLVSARDLAIAGRDLLSVPSLAQVVAEPALRFIGANRTVYDLASHNRAFLSTYPGADGVKTGYTDKAGICIAAAATRNGRTMLAVVLHGVDPDRTAALLLDQGFATPAALEPPADALPDVRLPEPAPPPTPATTEVPAPGPVPAPAAGVATARHVAADRGLLAQLSPGGSDSPGSLWPAPVAAVALAIVAALTFRRVRAGRHTPAHGRRR